MIYSSFFLCLTALFLNLSSLIASPYTICIDGGGSKTLMQVINQAGQLELLVQDSRSSDSIIASGSNINTVGIDGVRTAFYELFHDVQIGYLEIPLESLFTDCRVVAGMAGLSNEENKQIISSLFEEYGIAKDNIILLGDAELALQLIDPCGGVLISGTGSVAFAKQDGIVYQAGGLGPLLGDEGSGYHLALQGIKAALADEYGFGKPTSLTTALQEFFEVESLKDLIRPLTLREMLPADVAKAATVVFDEALRHHDPIAKELVRDMAHALSALITTSAEMADLHDCEIHLWGGTFKNPHADFLLHVIQKNPVIIERNLLLKNQAFYNASVLYAEQLYQTQNVE